jgi:hypothetical protein
MSLYLLIFLNVYHLSNLLLQYLLFPNVPLCKPRYTDLLAFFIVVIKLIGLELQRLFIFKFELCSISMLSDCNSVRVVFVLCFLVIVVKNVHRNHTMLLSESVESSQLLHVTL